MAQISASCDPGEPFYIFVCEAKAHRHCRPKRGADRALAEGGGCGDMPRKDDDFGEVCALGSSWHFVAQMTRGVWELVSLEVVGRILTSCVGIGVGECCRGQRRGAIGASRRAYVLQHVPDGMTTYSHSLGDSINHVSSHL